MPRPILRPAASAASKLPCDVMRGDAGFHANETRRQIGEPRFDLATRPFLTKDNCTTLVQADRLEGILANTDADYGNRRAGFLGQGVLWLSANEARRETDLS